MYPTSHSIHLEAVEEKVVQQALEDAMALCGRLELLTVLCFGNGVELSAAKPPSANSGFITELKAKAQLTQECLNSANAALTRIENAIAAL